MSTTQAAEGIYEATTPDAGGAGIIDSDIHPYVAGGIGELMPYMTKTWQHRLGIGQGDGWAGNYATSQFTLPQNYLYINSSGGMRGDTAAPGMAPASDADFTARQLLDPGGIARGVLLSGQMLGIGAMPDPAVADVLVKAYNDWMCENWLEKDERYRGAIVVAPQDSALAVQEIERMAKRRGIVEVALPLHDVLMGERHYYPIYEAAQRHGLPICVHPSGTENVYARAPRMAGTPTYYLEWHSLLGQIHQSNVASLLCHGVFEQFPELMVVCAEGGFMWAAELMWKLDRDWHGLRDEVPWVKRHPSDYLFDHVRFTTQPFLEPPKHDHLLAVLDMVQAERTLMFSSDYPHWDFDDPKRALAAVPADLRRRICFETPRAVFGERLD
jgi:predicted TIM-barrel fold metal-dependent hydrolase